MILQEEQTDYDADARAALDHLKSHRQCTGKLGAMGICVGGHLSFRGRSPARDRARRGTSLRARLPRT